MGQEEAAEERPRRKVSRREQEIEARKSSDPIAQAIGRDDIDYGSDELPTAPRSQGLPDTSHHGLSDVMRDAGSYQDCGTKGEGILKSVATNPSLNK